MMETWYKYNRWAWHHEKRIVPVQIEKHTEFTVWINNRRHKIRSDYDNYFPTFGEAQSFAINRWENKINRIKEELSDAEKELAIIKAETS